MTPLITLSAKKTDFDHSLLNDTPVSKFSFVQQLAVRYPCQPKNDFDHSLLNDTPVSEFWVWQCSIYANQPLKQRSTHAETLWNMDTEIYTTMLEKVKDAEKGIISRAAALEHVESNLTALRNDLQVCIVIWDGTLWVWSVIKTIMTDCLNIPKCFLLCTGTPF